MGGKKVIFHSNKVAYGQDYAFFRGVPEMVVFDVESDSGNGRLVLVAKGYGVMGGAKDGSDYGCGSLHVNKEEMLEAMKTGECVEVAGEIEDRLNKTTKDNILLPSGRRVSELIPSHEISSVKDDIAFVLLEAEGFPVRVIDALVWAAWAHKDQMRKNEKEKYIVHPIGVVRILLKSPWHFTENELIAAALHDFIEDCFKQYKVAYKFEMIARLFGEDVAGMVWLLSKPEERHLRREIYIGVLGRVAPVLLAIKLADILHNMSSLTGMKRDFIEQFVCKGEKDYQNFQDIVKYHGMCWHPYIDWIGPQIEEEIRKWK